MSKRYVVEESSIITRRQAEQFADEARANGCSALDLSKVDSVSRSVADELVHQTTDSELKLTGLTGDVRKMVEIISDSSPLKA